MGMSQKYKQNNPDDRYVMKIKRFKLLDLKKNQGLISVKLIAI